MNALKLARLEAELTQAELALKAGVSRQTIAKLEHDQAAVVKTTTLASLAEALGCSVADIFCA